MTEFDPDRSISLTKPTAPLEPWAPPGPTQRYAPAAPLTSGFGSPSGYGPPPGYPPSPMPYPVSTTTVVGQQSSAEMIIAWIFTALTLLYMLPWALAATRRSTNSIVIAIATFLLAWTGIGWLVLLVLSFLGPTVFTMQRSTTYVALPPPPPGTWAHCPTDPPHVRRWWDGRAWTAHTTVV